MTFFILTGSAIQAWKPEKEIHIPEKQMKDNKFNQPDGNFSDEYKAESENLVIFWDKAFGKDPQLNPDEARRFFPDEILSEGERFFRHYTDELRFVDKRTSFSGKRKMIIWIYDDDETSAFGWGDEGVGLMWFRPCRINGYPYCALAHEMGHSFQYMTIADGARGFWNPLVEYSSQWMLWQVYPDWFSLETYHLDAYMEQTHYSLMHEDNQYHAPQFMEYWAYRHGKDIIARIWKEAEGDEGIASAYRAVTGLGQEEFNAEIYDAACRFVTWDIPRIESVSSSFANRHTCRIIRSGEGRYMICPERCPQSYGYNAIRLNVPKPGSTVTIEFEGLSGTEGFRCSRPEEAGWRYGFVASLQNGKRVYGDMNTAVNGKNALVQFTVPESTQYLWLVVTGAPSVMHDPYIQWGKELKEAERNAEEFPYAFTLTGTSPHHQTIRK